MLDIVASINKAVIEGRGPDCYSGEIPAHTVERVTRSARNLDRLTKVLFSIYSSSKRQNRFPKIIIHISAEYHSKILTEGFLDIALEFDGVIVLFGHTVKIEDKLTHKYPDPVGRDVSLLCDFVIKDQVTGFVIFFEERKKGSVKHERLYIPSEA